MGIGNRRADRHLVFCSKETSIKPALKYYIIYIKFSSTLYSFLLNGFKTLNPPSNLSFAFPN